MPDSAIDTLRLAAVDYHDVMVEPTECPGCMIHDLLDQIQKLLAKPPAMHINVPTVKE